MLDALLAQTTSADALALAWFITCWFAYSYLTEHGRHTGRGLAGISHSYRQDWARQLLRREIRIMDSALIGNLMQSVSFYASTTIYLIVGLIALLGVFDRVVSVAAELPFASHAGREVSEIKLLLLLGVLVVAYFKFTWSLRQFNLLCLMLGAAPEPQSGIETREAYAQDMAAINAQGGVEFNRGIRAYYFGLAAMAWFIHPWLFMASTSLIALLLYRREFYAPAVRALRVARIVEPPAERRPTSADFAQRPAG